MAINKEKIQIQLVKALAESVLEMLGIKKQMTLKEAIQVLGLHKVEDVIDLIMSFCAEK